MYGGVTHPVSLTPLHVRLRSRGGGVSKPVTSTSGSPTYRTTWVRVESQAWVIVKMVPSSKDRTGVTPFTDSLEPERFQEGDVDGLRPQGSLSWTLPFSLG